jgi:hypothetical protein
LGRIAKHAPKGDVYLNGNIHGNIHGILREISCESGKERCMFIRWMTLYKAENDWIVKEFPLGFLGSKDFLQSVGNLIRLKQVL